MRTVIIVLAIGVLIVLYSQYVLLALVLAYILHGLLSRLFSAVWRRGESAEPKIETTPVGRSSTH